jgi:hypothetical protein
VILLCDCRCAVPAFEVVCVFAGPTAVPSLAGINPPDRRADAPASSRPAWSVTSEAIAQSFFGKLTHG